MMLPCRSQSSWPPPPPSASTSTAGRGGRQVAHHRHRLPQLQLHEEDGRAAVAGRRAPVGAGAVPLEGCQPAGGAQHRPAQAQAAPTDQGDRGVLGHAAVARGGHLLPLRTVHHYHPVLCLQLPRATHPEGDRSSVPAAEGSQDVHGQAGDRATPQRAHGNPRRGQEEEEEGQCGHGGHQGRGG